MKDIDIIKKVIDKLPDKDWEFYKRLNLDEYEIEELYLFQIDGWGIIRLRDLIFSHNFAKAFWGKDEREPKDSHSFEFRYKGNCLKYGHMSLWQYHLQQMVLQENPIKYLEKFL